MKTILLCVFILVTATSAYSQDTLITRKGELIGAKVLEIGKEEIRYKKYSNPDGPVYVIDKSDVVVIEYQNGSRDVFAEETTNPVTSGADDNDNQNRVYVDRRPALNFIVGAAPFFAFNPWGWGGWYSGWNRGWSSWRHHRGYSHHHHFGHYGRRGGGHR